MSRSKRPWLLFAACVAAIVVALYWLSAAVVRLEQAEFNARRVAEFEEALRLALWRMDGELTPILAQEEVRPYAHYSAFYPESGAFTLTSGIARRADVLVPSPLLGFESAFIRIHFQIDERGTVRSPEVPTGPMRTLARKDHVHVAVLNEAITMLDRAKRFIHYGRLLARLERRSTSDAPDLAAPAERSLAQIPNVQMFQSKGQVQKTQDEEAVRRARQNKLKMLNVDAQQQAPARNDVEQDDVARRGFVPLWLPSYDAKRRELLFVRRVTVSGRQAIQGFWASWPRIRKVSLDSIKDLFPNARLAPVDPTDGPPSGRMLASVPARLEPGPQPPVACPRITPARLMLAFAWGAIAFTTVAVGLALRAATDLSERRGNFVSAVTHELRTPLTTFRLYSEMLAEDMVREPDVRREYLATLRSEAERLSHLVENVLVFARVEDGRLSARRENLRVGDLLDRCAGRLENRAARSRMQIARRADPGDDAVVHADGEVIEQILFNLVDNACKYARDADDRRIHVSARIAGHAVEIRVRDHGPGVPRADRKRIFEPFTRAEVHDAGPAPGVGLGLALSRRLARDLGGGLRLDSPGADGATFVLSLPIVDGG